jgi:hypothetical protein
MPENNLPWTKDRMAARNRVIRQRNIALGLVLVFFVMLFFAITVVKMKHPHMPKKTHIADRPAAAAGASPGAADAR